MPAAEKSIVTQSDKRAASPDFMTGNRLGILAGGGKLPHRLIAACDKKGIDTFVIGFDGQTDPKLMEGRHHFWGRIGAASQIVKTLKTHDIKDLVLIGSVRRPAITELKPDLKTASFFARIGMRAMGDNDLLVCVREELERDGFTLHAIQDFVDDLLAPAGLLGRVKPSKKLGKDISHGIKVCQAIGRLDIGQSVIIQDGVILGVEGIEGTDALIRRCKDLKRKGGGGILIKLCKPMQDKSLDLPTIGPDTVQTCIDSGLDGIVIHAGQSLLLDEQRVVSLADTHKLFIMGVDVNEQGEA